MRNLKKRIFLLTCILINSSYAAFDIKNFTINSGGKKLSSNRFQLTGSIAQVDANTPLASSNYQLSPGFWTQNRQPNNDLIFINGFE